jgi:serine/threonine-protein kinase
MILREGHRNFADQRRRVTVAPMALRGGRYETLREIASGGMATVHLGRILGVGGFERVVAIKVMHPHLATDPQFVGMFLDEARLAARVRHPNVVGTIDILEDEIGLFLVMEYIEGPSLTSLLRAAQKRAAPITLGALLRIFLDALAGLHAAHELTDGQGELLNLVHRDVSPQNILVGSDGIARITDFGVARARSRITTTKGHEVKGKMSYLAPEQVRAEPIDRRADIYSAGVILWGLLTGRRMIRADNDGAIIAQILSATRPSPREVNPAVPPALDDVCMAAIALDPAARPATASLFAEAIEAAAARDGVTIAPSRAVAALVKDLEAHQALGDLPASKTPASSSIAPPSLASARAELSSSGVLPIIDDLVARASVSEPNLPVAVVEPASSTRVDAEVAAPAVATRRRLTWSVIALGVVVAALAAVTLARGLGDTTPDAAVPARTAVSAPALDPITPPVAAPTTIPSAIASAVAVATSSARASSGPAPTRPTRPVVKGSTPASSPTNFAPSEL